MTTPIRFSPPCGKTTSGETFIRSPGGFGWAARMFSRRLAAAEHTSGRGGLSASRAISLDPTVESAAASTSTSVSPRSAGMVTGAITTPSGG